MRKLNPFLIILLLFLISCSSNSSKLKSNSSEYIRNLLQTNIEYLEFEYKNDFTLVSYNGDYIIEINLNDIENISKISLSKIRIPYTLKKDGIIVDQDDFLFVPQSLYNNASILLSFDDYFSVWNDYIPLFTKKNIKATFFCYGDTSRVGAFCKKAQSAGLEVGFHTLTHKNLWSATEEQVYEEAILPLDLFKKEYIYYYSFAFPNGVYQPYQIDLLLKYYRVLRLFDNNFRLYDMGEISSSRVFWSQSIDSNKFINDEDFRNTLTKRLLAAKITNKIYPCTTHYIGYKSDGYNITPENLEWLMDTVNCLNIKSIRFRDIYANMYSPK